MVTRMFRDKFGRTVEFCINDTMVKSKQDERHTMDLNETFEILRRHKLRLNANKCAFGVGVEKFLGYMITNQGIEMNPDQIRAIKQLTPPKNPKDILKLTKMIAKLNCFFLKSADRCRPCDVLFNKPAHLV